MGDQVVLPVVDDDSGRLGSPRPAPGHLAHRCSRPAGSALCSADLSISMFSTSTTEYSTTSQRKMQCCLSHLRSRQGPIPPLTPRPCSWQGPCMVVRLDHGRLCVVSGEPRVGDAPPQGLDPPGRPRGPVVGALVLVLVATGHHAAWPGVGGRCGAGQELCPKLVPQCQQSAQAAPSPLLPRSVMSESATSYLSRHHRCNCLTGSI